MYVSLDEKNRPLITCHEETGTAGFSEKWARSPRVFFWKYTLLCLLSYAYSQSPAETRLPPPTPSSEVEESENRTQMKSFSLASLTRSALQVVFHTKTGCRKRAVEMLSECLRAKRKAKWHPEANWASRPRPLSWKRQDAEEEEEPFVVFAFKQPKFGF